MELEQLDYKVIRRCDTTPRSVSAIDFADRQYAFPLCCTSNYTNPLQTGDVVGVVLQSTLPHQAPYESTCRLVDNIQLFAHEEGPFTHTEEHFFRVTNVLSATRFQVDRVFLMS